MIISIGAGCFVTSFVFLLWEQQGFVPANSYPIKLLLALNFHLQIIQMWKKLKAYIPNWQSWRLLFKLFFFWAERKFSHWKQRINTALGIHQKLLEQLKYLRNFSSSIFAVCIYKCVSLFPQSSGEPCMLHSFPVVNTVSVLPLLHQRRFLSDCWRQLVQHKKVCVFICCGQTLRKDESM